MRKIIKLIYIFSGLRLLRRIRFLLTGNKTQIVRQVWTEQYDCHSDTHFIVKVGAHDGITRDPWSYIYNREKWGGLLIEPCPYNFEELRKNFSKSEQYILENVAIDNSDLKNKEFYFIKENAKHEIDELPYYFDMIGSFDKNHILKILDKQLDKELKEKIEQYITSRSVKTLKLSNLLEKHKIKNVSLLHIDAEGFDYQALCSHNFKEVKTDAVFIEHSHMSDEIKSKTRDLLKSHNFIIHDCGLDYLALNQNSYVPSLFDSLFTPISL